MKHDWLITFRSVTYAQKGERLLKKAGISCALQRTPKMLSQRGCGYCLRLRGTDVVAAAQQLREGGALFEKAYALLDGGKPEVREL